MLKYFSRKPSSDEPPLITLDRVIAPPLIPKRETRYFQVVHPGGVSVREDPAQPAKPDAKSFDLGDVLEVEGLGLAVPEGVLVEVKGFSGKNGGWVFQRHENQDILAEVSPPMVEEGNWWYRVVHSRGVRFVKIPSMDSQAPRHNVTVPQNTVVHACRRHTPAGSGVTFVEIVDGKGWIFQRASDNLLLEVAQDGQPLLEHATEEFREDVGGWYRVKSNLELLVEPKSNGPGLLEVFLKGKVFCSSERYQPPQESAVFLKVKGRPGWALLSEDEVEYCVELPPPMDEGIREWFRVEYPGGVRLRSSPSMDSKGGGVLVCGWVFLATRRFREVGTDQVFLEVSGEELSLVVTEGQRQHESSHEGEGSLEEDDVDPEGPEHGVQGQRENGVVPVPLGWVPATKESIEVVKRVEEPRRESGVFPYQIVVNETLQAKVGPHDQAPEVDQFFTPYSVVPVVNLLEVGSGSERECFVQVTDTGAWVRSRHGDDVKMRRLPAFPVVDNQTRQFTVVAEEGVETFVGPSALAPPTGNRVECGMEGLSSMLWSVGVDEEGEGKEPTVYALLDNLGWVRFSGKGEGEEVVVSGGIELEDLPSNNEEESSVDGHNA